MSIIDIIKKNEKKYEEEKKHMTAEEARSISEIGKERKMRETFAFREISDEEFENAVREFTNRCLENYIASAAERGDNHETIVPAHYKTANDDFERINRAKEIIEEMMSPYGYTVSWFCGTKMIAINW